MVLAMVQRLVAWIRRAPQALGRVPTAVVCLAALAIGVMYCSNDLRDRKQDPAAARGDGVYRPAMARGDGHMHFLVTRSLVFDRDVDFDNDLARFGDPWRQPRTVTGKKNVMQQLGPSLVWAPVLAAAHAAAVVVNVFGGDIETHGYTMFHQRILFASSVVFAWLALALGVLVARRLVGGRWAPALAGGAILLGTSLTYYATYMPSYAHAMDAAASAAFFAYWFVTLGDRRWRRFVVLGLLLGTAAMVRVQDVGFGIVVALELGVAAARRLREVAPASDRLRDVGRLLGRGALVLAITVALHVPQLYVWKQMYGAWLTTPQGPGQMRYAHPMVLELLFSSRNGWFSTTPLAYLGVIGLGLGVVRGPRLGAHVRVVCVGLLLAIATQVYINAITYEWWTGASFGNRRLCSVTLPLIVGLAVLLRAVHVRVRGRVPARAQVAIAVLALGWFVAWNLAWVGKLRDGRSAGRTNTPTCCADVPRPLRWVAQPIYDLVGNPFELPASAYFALRHGVDLRRWDRAVGSYPLVPGVLGYQDGSYRAATGTWNLANAGGAPYLLDGWGPPQRVDAPARRLWRWTVAPRAELLLPLLMPEPHRIVVPIAANAAPGETVEVVVSCNGEVALRAQVGAAWTELSFDTDGEIGTTVIGIAAPVAPYRVTPGTAVAMPPPRARPVGVAIGPLRVGLPPRP